MRQLSPALLMFCFFSACGPVEGFDPLTGEGVAVSRANLTVENLYAKLREGEGLLALPPPTETIAVGRFDCSTGTFTGLRSFRVIDSSGKPSWVPPVVSINAVNAVLSFQANCAPLTLTVGSQTVTSTTNSISLDVGAQWMPSWTLNGGGRTVSDRLQISRPQAFGAGAFTLAALPVSVVYEPPQNLAFTNRATVSFREEMTTITTVSRSESNSVTKPKWAARQVFSSIINTLAHKPGIGVAASNFFGGVEAAIGSTETTTTTGTTVNTDSSLGVSQVLSTSISTAAHTGPGRGDLVVFYKNARVAWAMNEGQVSLMLFDHGPLVVATVDTLRADLAAVQSGAVAPVTQLDAVTLTGLLSLDPNVQLNPKASTALSAPRFKKETSLVLNGTSFNNSVSHTITSTDQTSTLNTRTNVTETHAGWLSVIGIGYDGSTTSTTLSLGTSRTDVVSNTVSASFDLQAAATESYTVDVFYDAIFDSFVTRKPVVFQTF